MTYDFSRFSTQSFERFAQALAVLKFGPTTQIFGAGKDGAREATFEGKIKLTNEQIWDGYTVIQAKYQVVPGQLPQNAAWVIRQIDLELGKFADVKRGLRQPDYYVLVTNVRLSAAAADASGSGEGGIDKVEAHLRKKCSALGMKGWVLWHADSLETLLDTEPTLKTSFDFWITPGDVLTAALKKLQDDTVETFLPTYLRSNFRNYRDVKTKDAGQTTGRRIFLDNIFVDLPIDEYSLYYDELEVSEDEFDEAESLLDGPPDQDEINSADDDAEPPRDDDGGHPLNIAKTIIERCADTFKPPENEECHALRTRNCLVVMGGPGQGKSTLMQFIGQFFRARLLKAMPGNTEDLPEFIELVLSRANDEGLPLVGPARFPISVDLPVFADALNRSVLQNKPYSLLQHIAGLVAAGQGELSVLSLRRWLSAVPSIFILDGLDEVPHSSNRSQVVSAISDLIDALNDINADYFSIVTSRPQGYQNDLPSKVWSHWEMAALKQTEALRYGGQLASVLVADDLRRLEIIDTLRVASCEETTAPLMTSPLQVSLLFALVETRNNIPKDRWTLFYRYYEILRDREISKGGESGGLIGQYKSEIDRLHYETGYLLHARGEESGGAHSFLTESEFHSVVSHQLQRSGYDEDLATLADKIVQLATHRLVFLRSRTDGEIAFEVRSLQEFMAAARIMTSPEAAIKGRLREIAGITHWLHVFKIACSKVYSSAELEELRDDIITIIDGLDHGDRETEDALIKSGALLAAQLLQDGIAGQTPQAKRSLLTRALRLLETHNPNAPQLLEKAFDQSVMKSVEPDLVQYLRGSGWRRDQALRLLCLLCGSDNVGIQQWAEGFMATWLPPESEEILRLASSRVYLKGSFRKRVIEALWCVPIAVARRWFDLTEIGDRQVTDADLFRRFGFRGSERHWCRLLFCDHQPSAVQLSFRRINNTIQPSEVPETAHIQWRLAKSIGDFGRNPNLVNLGSLVKELVALEATDIPWPELPWIVINAYTLVISQSQRADIISIIHDSDLGDPDDWLKTELECIKGIYSADLLVGPLAESLKHTTQARYSHGIEFNDQSNETVSEFLLSLLQIQMKLGSPSFDRVLLRALTRYQGKGSIADFASFLTQQIHRDEPARFSQLTLAHLSLVEGVENKLISANVRLLCSKMKTFTVIRGARKQISEIVSLLEKTGEPHYLILLAGILAVEPHHRVKQLIETTPSIAIQVDAHHELAQEAVAIIGLLVGQLSEISALRTVSPLLIKRALSHSNWDEDVQSKFLREFAYGRMASARHGSVTLHTILSEVMEKRQSGLHDQAKYSSLKLPRPLPSLNS